MWLLCSFQTLTITCYWEFFHNKKIALDPTFEERAQNFFNQPEAAFHHFKRYDYDVYMCLTPQNISERTVEADFWFETLKKFLTPAKLACRGVLGYGCQNESKDDPQNRSIIFWKSMKISFSWHIIRLTRQVWLFLYH